ncbi:hypothetical protein ACFYUD_36315 [Nocardia tengchongensis]|uniref:hypothetical protein n=1 Tax=Nocardia tengchongensis TaxID=2055889 RepID=UPI003694F503
MKPVVAGLVRQLIAASMICPAMAAAACTSGGDGGVGTAATTTPGTTTGTLLLMPMSVPATTTQVQQRALPPQTTIAAPPQGDLLVGVWRSVADPTDIRTFAADGTAIEQAGTGPYAVTARKRWDWVTHTSAVGGPPVTDLVLRLIPTDAPNPLGVDGVFFYSVDFDDADTLELMYLGGPVVGPQYKRVQ